MKKFMSFITILIMLTIVSCTTTIANRSTAVPINSIQTETTSTEVTTVLLTQTPTIKLTNALKSEATHLVTATPSTKPAQKSQIKWGDILKSVRFDGDRGIWANTEDTFLFTSKLNNDTAILSKVTVPEFLPVTLFDPIVLDDFTWSPDDRFILYSSSSAGSGIKQIYIMDPGAKSPWVVNTNILSMHYISFRGWLNSHSLIFTDYTSGGHIGISALNIKTGKQASWSALIHGSTFIPKNGFIPAFSDTDEMDPRLVVISEQFSRRAVIEGRPPDGGNLLVLPEYKSIPGLQTTSYFADWLPGSNQILVKWHHLDPTNFAPIENDLLLWDIEKNKVRLIAPSAKAGKFSPDGQVLAYQTSGPAKLDSNSRPVQAGQISENTLSSYMQLLDMMSGKVFLSIPVLAKTNSDTNQDFIDAWFSPDSHYLAFYGPGKVIVDASGWPQSLDIANSSPASINLLDIQGKRLVWSSSADEKAVLSWSPTGDYFAYQDADLNWQLMDVKHLTTIPITQFWGKALSEPAWSHDGKYLSFNSCEPTGVIDCHRSIYIFDVTIPE